MTDGWYKHADGSMTLELEVVKVTEHGNKLSDGWKLEYVQDLPRQFGILDPRKVKNMMNQIASALRKENKRKGRP